ncbi:hypothetical protein SteCoe_4164 [Stentor coeruleus]|uniref:Protein kinase domain-containing protein n=1 Tax=Stentor coeruleus TaxID=5963 RepID=A0A1R2CVA3_9CILI|nr:hypothetical protein SteCoe_4164 [Stentor coeruleus]
MEKLKSSDVILEKELWKMQERDTIVYLGYRKSSPKEKICVKVQTLNSINEANIKMMEIMSLANSYHQNIVRLFSMSIDEIRGDKCKLYSFIEYFPEGNLDNLIEKRMLSKSLWTQEEILNYAHQLINAMAYLQEKEISHRDLKPGNIFLSNNYTVVKIGEFQESKKITTEIQTIRGSPMYFSPLIRKALSQYFITHVFQVHHNSYKSDVYSLGIILLQMASLMPVNALCSLENLQENINSLINSLSDDHFKIKLLLDKMLQVEENSRDDFFTLLPYVIKLIEAEYGQCPECNKYYFHDDFFIIDNDFICSKCIYGLNMIYEFKLYCCNCQEEVYWNSYKMICSCVQDFNRCIVCKDYKHENMTCIEKLKMSLIEDSYCIRFICECKNWLNLNTENLFFECSNCGFFCVVCGKNWNDFSHKTCNFMIKYFHILKEVYYKQINIQL